MKLNQTNTHSNCLGENIVIPSSDSMPEVFCALLSWTKIELQFQQSVTNSSYQMSFRL